MFWELWSLASKNLIDTFDTEDEALHGVRDFLAVNHLTVPDSVALSPNYDEGESHEIPLPPALAGAELRARLAETAPAHAADDATRAVHEKIRRWLAEEGWQVEAIPVPPGSFNIVAIHHDGRAINIFQHADHVDHIALSLRWTRDYVRGTIGRLPDDVLEDLVWSIYRDVTTMGVEFHGIDATSTAMILRADVYFDGITKDTLMHRIQLVNQAYTLAMRTFVRALQAPGHSGVRTLSLEDVRRIVRPVSQTDVPLTIAG